MCSDLPKMPSPDPPSLAKRVAGGIDMSIEQVAGKANGDDCEEFPIRPNQSA